MTEWVYMQSKISMLSCIYISTVTTTENNPSFSSVNDKLIIFYRKK